MKERDARKGGWIRTHFVGSVKRSTAYGVVDRRRKLINTSVKSVSAK